MRKSKTQQVMAGVKFPVEEKNRLMGIAQRREQTLTDLVKDGVELMAGLPDDFLKQFQKICDTTRLPFSTVFVQFLLVYAAQDAACLKVYEHSNTFQRAFQFDHEGLITGDKLSEKVYNEVLKNAKDLKKRMKENADGKTENLVLSKPEAAQISIQMRATG